MISRSFITTACLLALCVGACGNYSNEDVDFQLALPEQSDVEAKMPEALTVADSCKYYVETRSAVTNFNTMVSTLVGLIDTIRGVVPTSRDGDTRVWGPFPSDKYANWEVRVIMTKSIDPTAPTLLHMVYEVQIRRRAADWISYLSGDYTSAGSARKGSGHLHLHVETARQGTYPVDADGLGKLKQLDVAYQTADFPVHVSLAATNVDTEESRNITYEYYEQQDGSGQMSFDLDFAALPGATATFFSRWLGSGAGRGDLIYSTNNTQIIAETQCWGIDTVATHSTVKEQPLANPTACVFPDPPLT